MSPKPQPGIMDISLYQGGKSAIQGVNDVVKLSSNENPYGPSPRASDAVRQAAGKLHLYPSTDHQELRDAIAQTHDLPMENVVRHRPAIHARRCAPHLVEWLHDEWRAACLRYEYPSVRNVLLVQRSSR